jgi:PIN domain nuclease of toxin-antitoxin system
VSRFLLDTHILIWWLADAPQLKPEIKRMLECDDAVFYVSAATVWEIGTKQALGKLSVAADLLLAIRGNDFQLLSISAEHADYATKLPLHHKDPFDRLLIAQASLENIAIISQDGVFALYMPFPFLRH